MEDIDRRVSIDSSCEEEMTFLEKLRIIRPFTESQLLVLHQIPELDENDAIVDTFLKDCIAARDTSFHAKFAQLKEWKHLLESTKARISELSEKCDESQDRVWKLNCRTISKKSRCNDGRLVEANHIYNYATVCPEVVKHLDQSFDKLYKSISNHHCYNLFMTQYTQKLVQIAIKEVIDLPESPEKTAQLKNLITCMFDFTRQDDGHSEFSGLCKQWLSRLISILLTNASYQDRLFVLNHVLRCASGIQSWSTGFVQCPNPIDSGSDEEVNALNHALTVLYTILSPVPGRGKMLGIIESSGKPSHIKSTDDAWLLVDSETDESEEVFANKSHFTESDIISLLKQVPFGSIIKFITGEHNGCPGSSGPESFAGVSEVTMLKLLATASRIVKVLKQGLNTFNCMRFKKLTLHVTSLIRKTVRAVSKFWLACKEHFRTEDEALLLRLQVEYDHFILRAMSTILECQRYGVWKFISVIPFDGVTEAMMWHLLWVVYNNGHGTKDGDKSPYHDAEFWKPKFSQPEITNLFHEKLLSLSNAESLSLLTSMCNMAKSRSTDEKDFVNVVTSEIFGMTFIQEHKFDKVKSKCAEILSQLIGTHTFLMNAIIAKIEKSNLSDESILDCFEKIPLMSWVPENETFEVLNSWLVNSPTTHFYNKLSRTIYSKLDWGHNVEKLFLSVDHHRSAAIQLYAALKNHVFVEGQEDPFALCKFTGFSDKTALAIARDSHPKIFAQWCWRMLLVLKLHVLEQPRLSSSIWKDPSHESFKLISGFESIPDTETDVDLFPICSGIKINNPVAIYIALEMTNKGHKQENIQTNTEAIIHLLTSQNYIQTLKILAWFIPLNIDNSSSLISNNKFLVAFNSLLCESNELADRLLGMIRIQLTDSPIKSAILSFWLKLLYEIAALIIKQWSTSWFATGKGLQRVVHVIDNLIELTSQDDELHQLLLEFVRDKPYDDLFVKQISSSHLFSWLPWRAAGADNRRCDWLSPFNVLKQKFPDKLWLSWIVIEADMQKMEKCWEEVVSDMGVNVELEVENALKAVCVRNDVSFIPLDFLPINAWAQLIVSSSLDFPLLPVFWYNYYCCFFTNASGSGSVGHRVVKPDTLRLLKTKVNNLVEHHHCLWLSASDVETKKHHAANVKLYRSYLQWMEDDQLHEPYVDIVRLPPQYDVELLKTVLESTSEREVSKYVSKSKLEERQECYTKLWSEIVELDSSSQPLVSEEDEIEECELDSAQACNPGNLDGVETFATTLTNRYIDPVALLPLLKHIIKIILDEAKFFESRLKKMEDLDRVYIDKVADLYENRKREITLKLQCNELDGKGCTGSSALTFEFFEATENQVVAKEIARNRTSYNVAYLELLDVPSENMVTSILHTEKCLEILNLFSNDRKAQHELWEYFLSAISHTNYIIYPPTKHLFKVFTEAVQIDGLDLTGTTGNT
ncbi:Ectopic P granules protein 5 -like protein [Halotydeus destructor]|nr:Ectopic P granules protein 5 -like protein [Halotydeus destructor]